MNRNLTLFLLLFLLTLVFVSCEKEVIKTTAPTGDITFATVSNIFSSRGCAGCHGGSAFVLSLENLKSMGLVTAPGATCGLIKKIEAGHNSGSVTGGDKATIASWIDKGTPAK